MTKAELDAVKLRFRVAVTLATPEYQRRTAGYDPKYSQAAVLASWQDIPSLLGWLKEVEDEAHRD